MSAAVSALADEIRSFLPSWARSKGQGQHYTLTPDVYWDKAVPKIAKAGHHAAALALGEMMFLSWGKKGRKGEAGPEWVPLPMAELAGKLGLTRNWVGIVLNALEKAGALESRPNPKDKRSKEYRVCVEQLGNVGDYDAAYKDLVAQDATVADDDDEPLSDPDEPVGFGDDDDDADAPREAVLRLGRRSIPLRQVAAEAHLCKSCTHSFIAYAEQAISEPAMPVENTNAAAHANAESKGVAAKVCKVSGHTSPVEKATPATPTAITRLRSDLATRFVKTLGSAPPDNVLAQVEAKLSAAGASVESFLSRCDMRARTVKSWGMLLHLADDVAGAERVLRDAKAAREPTKEPALSLAERVRIWATEWIRECETRGAPEEIAAQFEWINREAKALSKDHTGLNAVIRDAERQAAAWARVGLPAEKEKQIQMIAKRTGANETDLTLNAARLPNSFMGLPA